MKEMVLNHQIIDLRLIITITFKSFLDFHPNGFKILFYFPLKTLIVFQYNFHKTNPLEQILGLVEKIRIHFTSFLLKQRITAY